MSIFIPNRSIKLPKDISVPQSLSPSVFETQRRDQAFQMSKRFDGALVDVVSGAKAASVISGVRYGIVNGVVTEFGVNQPALEDDGLRGCPAFMQLCKQSETFASWNINGMLLPVLAGSFRGKNIWNCVESTTLNAIHQITQPDSYGTISDNMVIGISVVAKYSGRRLFFVGLSKSGLYKTCTMNLQTGVVEYNNGIAASITDIGDGYYKVFFAFNVELGATIPFLNIQTDNGVSNQYTGDGVSGVYLGQPTLINFGVNGIPFIPPYVPNDTTGSISVVSEAATATTGSIFDLDNALLARLKDALIGPNAQGHLELIVKSNVDSAWWANNSVYNILSVNNTSESLIYINKDSGGAVTLRTTDGTNVASVTQGLTVGSTYKISIDWGIHPTGQKMRLTVNGAKSSVVAFSGSFGSQDFRFFVGNTVHAGWIKDIKYYDRPRW